MTLIEKFKFWRIQRNWKKQGRKDLFTWIHRYLRLHSELLEDDIYKQMLDYHRNTLIAYLKRDVKDKNISDALYGELIDVLADFFNKNAEERVNKYKPIVDELYKSWKNDPNMIRDIRI